MLQTAVLWEKPQHGCFDGKAPGFVIARRPKADVAISGRHYQFVQGIDKMVSTNCVCSGAQGAPYRLAVYAALLLWREVT